jgi:hypothetical protein
MNRQARFAGLLVLVLSAGGLIALAAIEPITLLRGWLAAFVWAGMIPIGSLILLLINRLTGGAWGIALNPVLESAARAIWIVALAAIPVLIFSAAIYRWPLSPQTPKSLTGAYMTAPLFALRSVIAFCIWGMLAWIPALRSTVLGSAIGLFALAILTNVIPVDWVVSAQPGYYSSDFGFGFGIEQVLTALALCALSGATGGDRSQCRDLAGMLIAAVLGTTYMYYMEFAVIWYGNLPGKVDWFNIRGDAPWAEIGGAAFAIGALFPFLFLLNEKVRESSDWLRLIGAAILIGELLHAVWLVVPSFGLAALLPACLALLVAGLTGVFWLFGTAGAWRAVPNQSGRTAQSNG